jgi:hypothetical protein
VALGPVPVLVLAVLLNTAIVLNLLLDVHLKLAERVDLGGCLVEVGLGLSKGLLDVDAGILSLLDLLANDRQVGRAGLQVTLDNIELALSLLSLSCVG